MAETYGRLPISFEANQGQTDRQVKFLNARQWLFAIPYTQSEAVLSLRSLEINRLKEARKKERSSSPHAASGRKRDCAGDGS